MVYVGIATAVNLTSESLHRTRQKTSLGCQRKRRNHSMDESS
jgi:hypothetical protein